VFNLSIKTPNVHRLLWHTVFFIHKLGEVQSVTTDIPETVQNKITELMVNHKKKIIENLGVISGELSFVVL
jgi:hypothetical protein